MTDPIRIFRHVACEGPGYLGIFLERHGVPWEMVCIDDNRLVPQQVDDVSGLVFMGGAMSVNDPHDWINDELTLIRHAHEAGIPMMGICFGGQLISKAFGGEVVRGPAMEIGWHPITRCDSCECDSWLDGLPISFPVFHWHAETFSAPPGSKPLLRSECFGNQAFVINKHLSMQFHLEMTEEMVKGWINHYGSDLKRQSQCIQAPDELTRNLGPRLRRLNEVADRVYGRWLERVMDHAR